jgi:hypothetical protein
VFGAIDFNDSVGATIKVMASVVNIFFIPSPYIVYISLDRIEEQ